MEPDRFQRTADAVRLDGNPSRHDPKVKMPACSRTSSKPGLSRLRCSCRSIKRKKAAALGGRPLFSVLNSESLELVVDPNEARALGLDDLGFAFLQLSPIDLPGTRFHQGVAIFDKSGVLFERCFGG